MHAGPSPFSVAASFWGVILFLIFLFMSITGWGSIHTKVQRLWRYQQLWWLWRRRNPCLYNRKMWKRILWILGRKKIASSSHSVFARCRGGRWSRALLVEAVTKFLHSSNWVRSLLRHQCAPATTCVPRHRSAGIGRAITQCTPLPYCWLFSPPSCILFITSLTSAPFYFLVFQMAVLWLCVI